jgi:XTP/dITP diphosphohydrolase
VKEKLFLLKKGLKGFGYDPVFKPNGHKFTFAEMDMEIKNTIGHRAKAVKKLIEFLTKK